MRGDVYLPADGSAGLARWGRLEDPLLLLGRERGVQRDDFDVSHLRAQVINFSFDAFASFVNFLKIRKTDNLAHKSAIYTVMTRDVPNRIYIY